MSSSDADLSDEFDSNAIINCLSVHIAHRGGTQSLHDCFSGIAKIPDDRIGERFNPTYKLNSVADIPHSSAKLAKVLNPADSIAVRRRLF